MRILTVCLGNICRSPAAEAAIRQAADERGIEVEVDSSGTGGYHVGEPPDSRMREAGSRVGLQIQGRARRFERADFDRYDLILVMDRQNRSDVLELAPDPESAGKVRLFRSFDPEADDADAEVPDPYYGGTGGFEDVIEMVRRTADRLMDQVQGGRL